jgi:transmembrane 9 superfamily protein 2/4
MGKDEICKYYASKTFGRKEIEQYKWLMDRDYRINFYLDKLPAAHNYNISDHSAIHYYAGIPIGQHNVYVEQIDYIIYNHYTFRVSVYKNNGVYAIVGFSAAALSVQHEDKDKLNCHDEDEVRYNRSVQQLLKLTGESFTVHYTYDVEFVYTNIPFSSRWDHYMHLQNDDIHWFSLINSGIIILIFSIIVLFIFTRALKRDIEIYNTVSG